MNISQWPLSKIMQLPDHVFGQRFLVSVQLAFTGLTSGFAMAEIGLPEQCVIWEFGWVSQHEAVKTYVWDIALGNVLPTSIAQFNLLEPLFSNFGERVGTDFFMTGNGPSSLSIRNLRMPLTPSARNLVVRINSQGIIVNNLFVYLVVSSIPKDIPECLNLG